MSARIPSEIPPLLISNRKKIPDLTIMKKCAIVTAFIITTAFLFGQASASDLERDEIENNQYNPGPEFSKQPYLLFEGDNTQMRVIWQLDETDTSQIYWGEDNTYNLGNASTTEHGDDHQHTYTITGLKAGTKYFYKVISSNAMHEATFRTAPTATEIDLNFFMFADTRTQYWIHDDISAAMIADYQDDSTFQTISISTGDLVTYGAEESSWQTEFFNILGLNTMQYLAEIPFVSCLGNHELFYKNYSGMDTTTALFGKYFPYPYVDRRYWSFDYGPVHFTLIDQYKGIYTGHGMIDDEQLEWIENDLSTTSKDWKIVVLHEPGWSAGGSSSGIPHTNNDDVQNLLQPLFEQYGVQMVQCGHNHYYARAVKNGILHLTTAGGGAELYSPDPGYTNVMQTSVTHHYCKAEINGSSLSITVLTPDGDTVDKISMSQNYRPSHLLGFVSKEDGPGNISDIAISAGGNNIHPDSNGYYGLELEPGTYDVHFTLPGYSSIKQQVEIFAGTETQLDIIMLLIDSSLPDIESEFYHFSISPNPITDVANLTINKTSDELINVTIYNLHGISLKRWQFFTQHPCKNAFDMDLADLPAGHYICQIQSGDKTETKKLLKH